MGWLGWYSYYLGILYYFLTFIIRVGFLLE